MRFSVLILGNGSAIPKPGTYPHSQLLFHNTDKAYLLDCGEATQMRLLDNKVKFNKITKIFITHLHGDHFFGIFGLLSSMALLQRQKKLDVYGPKGLRDIISLMFGNSQTNIPYELNIHEIDTTKYSLVVKDDNLETYSVPLKHSINCCGFLFKESIKNSLEKSKIYQYNLDTLSLRDLKEGKSIKINGKRFKADFFIKQPAKTSRTYAYITDTLYDVSIVNIIKNADLLYHEATYTEEYANRANNTYHSTAKQAALIAKQANVKKLIIGHLSNRYTSPNLHIQEAQEVFENTMYAQEYKLFII